MLSTGCLKDLPMTLLVLQSSQASDTNKQTVMATDRHRSEGAAVAGHSFFTSICLSHFKTNDSVRNCPGDESRNCQGDDLYYILDSVPVSPKPVPLIIVPGIIRIQSSSSYSFLLHECYHSMVTNGLWGEFVGFQRWRRQGAHS
jgi:hypothetical protein